MSKNPKRTPENQIRHDSILQALAKYLDANYNVKADHINWKDGSPDEYYGHIPDIIATSNVNRNYIMEVENCSTYADDHTKEQMKAFAKVSGYICYIIIPKVCYRNDNSYDQKPEMRNLLNTWGLSQVQIGLYDWDNKTFEFK